MQPQERSLSSRRQAAQSLLDGKSALPSAGCPNRSPPSAWPSTPSAADLPPKGFEKLTEKLLPQSLST